MENKENGRIVLPGLTTTDRKTWRNKVEEIDRLGIKQIALFPTCIDLDERKEMFNLLEKTSLERIPHVHLRDDFKEEEVGYLIKNYHTEVFNIHADLKNLRLLSFNEYKNKFFVENQDRIETIFCDMVDESGGVCLDVSHWEDYGAIQKNLGYEKFGKLLGEYFIGCCHISAIKNKIKKCKDGEWNYTSHVMNSLSDLDYVKKYVKYFPKYVSIELENSLEEQLEIKKYLERIINNHEK
jgi:hypothetical protein